jgi:hypothetical protein
VPATEVPDLLTWYLTVAPLQKWNVRVAGAPSVSVLRKPGVRVMTSLV